MTANDPSTKPRVGFIGVGSQGGPMARRIVDGGFALTLWARRPESLAPYADTDAAVVPTPAALGAASDVVGICVVADADVEAVLLGPDGVLAGMAPGGVVMIHSTIHPATCERLAAEAGRRGVAIIDAPVSGGGHKAAERALLVMVGGEAEAVERCRPVLETFANPLLHLGPLGSGQLAKLTNNLVFTVQVGIAIETLALADELGIDRAALAQVLASGSGGSTAMAILGMSGFDVTGLSGAAPLLRKDVDLVLDVVGLRGAARPDLLAELADRTISRLSGARPTET